MKTPCAYYGGKQKLVKYILPLIPDDYKIYVEPFAGGLAILFAKEKSKVEVINDINGEVMNFYIVMKTRFEELHKKVDITMHSRSQFNQAKKIYRNPKKHNAIDRAWAFWILTNQSHTHKIGGGWKTSDRLAKGGNPAVTLRNRKRQFSIYENRLMDTDIECIDALELIKRRDSIHTFFYLDPPYYNADMGHYRGYTLEDYKNLLDLISGIEGKFLLSSYPSDILAEYTEKNNWNQNELTVKLSAGGLNKTKNEVLTWNYKVEFKQCLLNFFYEDEDETD